MFLLNLWLFFSMTIISLYKIYESMFPGNSRVSDKHFFFRQKSHQWLFRTVSVEWSKTSLIMGRFRKVNRKRIKTIAINNPFVYVFGRYSRVKWKWLPSWGRKNTCRATGKDVELQVLGLNIGKRQNWARIELYFQKIGNVFKPKKDLEMTT